MMLFFNLLLLSHSCTLALPVPPAPPPGYWKLSVQGFNKHTGNRIPFSFHFLGLLSSAGLEEVFCSIGLPYTGLPLGEYVLEELTVNGYQILLDPLTGDRYGIGAPKDHNPGHVLDLQSIGYEYVWGSSQSSEASVEVESAVTGTDSVEVESAVTGTDSVEVESAVTGTDSVVVESAVTGTDSVEVESAVTGTDFEHKLVMDSLGKYQLSWSLGDIGITFKIEAETLGFVGLGFSPNGGMIGADIVIAWVDDDSGEVHLTDRHGLGFFLPPLDASQDLTLLHGYQNETHTVVEFHRDLITCDNEDAKLGPDTVKMIWAYHQQDRLQYHTPLQRGVQSVSLGLTQAVDKSEEDHKVWDIWMEDLVVPHSDVTTYMSKIAKAPPTSSKHSIVAIESFIQPGNERFVHHMLLFQCHMPPSMGTTADVFEKFVDQPPVRSRTSDMPQEYHFCSTLLHGWIVGSKKAVYPENAGVILGEEFGGATYFLIEIHYDNTAKLEDIVDSSGFRVFYSDQPREYDMAMLTLGLTFGMMQVIPPEQSLFTSTSYCRPECTNSTLPAEGVAVFAGLMHTHEAGRKVRVRHVRGGVELPVLMEDNHYDPNFQVFSSPASNMRIMPGDMLITECEYETSAKKEPIYGGLGRNGEEMCLAYLLYYPKTSLVDCRSMVTVPTLMNSLGLQETIGNSFEQLLSHTSHDSIGPKLSNLPNVIEDLSSSGQLRAEVGKELSDPSFYLNFSRQRNVLLEILMSIRTMAPSNETIEDVVKKMDWQVGGDRMSKVLATGEQKCNCNSKDKALLIPSKYFKPCNFTVLLKNDENCMHLFE